MKKSLTTSEWTLVGIFLIVMASLVLIAKVNKIRAGEEILAAEPRATQVLVTIDGAVKNPGEYWVPKGTLVEAALQKARPRPDADVAALPLKEILTGARQFTVPELREIRVWVEGAVAAAVELVLPVGSRISDLKAKVAPTDETDRAFFRRKRLLKHGEKIEVPKKRLERN